MPVPQCAECGRALEQAEPRRVEVGVGDEQALHVFVFCPECAEREFDS